MTARRLRTISRNRPTLREPDPLPTFIDESGDTGRVAGASSDCFRLAAVWVPTKAEANACRDTIRELRTVLELPPSFREFHYADLGKDNFDLAHANGAVPYIPFKVNSVGDRQGDVWRRMFHLFQFHRADFLKHYHQRRNVESTFSMVKRKFGDSLRSKSLTALHNEALAKLGCHNIVVLVHEMYELGTEPHFGGLARPDADLEPRILRFPGA